MRRSPPTLTEEPSALEAATAAAKELDDLKSRLIPNHASSEAPSSLKAC